MTCRPHGKHVSIDPDNPEALGICDYTGFVHMRKDLVQQMDWRGNALVWTGLYVGRDYADKPNEQLRPPILPPDPVPVLFPRVQQPTIVTFSTSSSQVWSKLTVYDWVSWSGSPDGMPCLPAAQRLSTLQSYNWGAG